MNEDQEVPAISNDLGTVFTTTLSSPYYHQNLSSDNCKPVNTGNSPSAEVGALLGAPYPEWRESWPGPQDGNSCSTEPEEQYVPDSDYQVQNSLEVKPETEMSELIHCLNKNQSTHPSSVGSNYPPPHNTTLSYTPSDVYDNLYTPGYQPPVTCFSYSPPTYCRMYFGNNNNRSTSPRQIANQQQNQTREGIQGHLNPGGIAHLPIKQEPADREYDCTYRYDRTRSTSPLQVSKNLWRQPSPQLQTLPRCADKIRDENAPEIRTPPTSNSNQTGRRGSLQLWQFLVALLDAPDSSAGCIAWTGRGMEFKLIEPEEVARRWGAQKNRPAMNYDKLSRSLRYYYEKGIMQKVAGERYVYKFVCDPEALFNMAYGAPADSCGVRNALSNRAENLSVKTRSPEPPKHQIAYSEMLNLYNCGLAHSRPYQHLHTYLPEAGNTGAIHHKHTRYNSIYNSTV